MMNYMTATADEGGGITNIDESATDNDFEFKSFLQGLGGPTNFKVGNVNMKLTRNVTVPSFKGKEQEASLLQSLADSLSDVKSQFSQALQKKREITLANISNPKSSSEDESICTVVSTKQKLRIFHEESAIL